MVSLDGCRSSMKNRGVSWEETGGGQRTWRRPGQVLQHLIMEIQLYAAVLVPPGNVRLQGAPKPCSWHRLPWGH
jgi:hypothetical protein